MYENLIDSLEQIEEKVQYHIKDEINELLEKLRDKSEGFRLKSKLEVLVDKPLMKIKQLDPRIIDYRERKADPITVRQKLKKKITKEKK